jgi:hypothetical protein
VSVAGRVNEDSDVGTRREGHRQRRDERPETESANDEDDLMKGEMRTRGEWMKITGIR